MKDPVDTINENMKSRSWEADTVNVEYWQILSKFIILNPVKFNWICVEKKFFKINFITEKLSEKILDVTQWVFHFHAVNL